LKNIIETEHELTRESWRKGGGWRRRKEEIKEVQSRWISLR
jgi:hypothetical protein